MLPRKSPIAAVELGISYHQLISLLRSRNSRRLTRTPAVITSGRTRISLRRVSSGPQRAMFEGANGGCGRCRHLESKSGTFVAHGMVLGIPVHCRVTDDAGSSVPKIT